jgi:hypothetical protein
MGENSLLVRSRAVEALLLNLLLCARLGAGRAGQGVCDGYRQNAANDQVSYDLTDIDTLY